MKILKEKIKSLAEEQSFLKDQRRTAKIAGERKLEPWEAAMTHQVNRENLRIMYAAYGIAKGKKFSDVENHYPEEGHPLNVYKSQIDKIISTVSYGAALRADQ